MHSYQLRPQPLAAAQTPRSKPVTQGAGRAGPPPLWQQAIDDGRLARIAARSMPRASGSARLRKPATGSVTRRRGGPGYQRPNGDNSFSPNWPPAPPQSGQVTVSSWSVGY